VGAERGGDPVSMRLRELWESQESSVGGWCRIPSAFSAEVMGRAGFDWVCVDTQHGLAGQETMVSMLQAIDGCGIPGLVRVGWNQPDLIMRALDAGAQGVIVPMVNNAAGARQAAGASRYAPLGYRSWGQARNAVSVEAANNGVVCLVMIETPKAVANLSEILTVPGVDGVYVGPSDLAISCGHSPGDSGPVEPLIAAVQAACKDAARVAGIHCPDAETARRRRSEGFTMMAVANDATLLGAGAAAAARCFREEHT